LGKKTRNNFLSKRVLDIKRNKQFFTSNINFKFNNFIHVNNLLEIIHFILKKNIKNSIFNLCLKDHISLKKIYSMIEKEIKRKINYKVIDNKSYYSISSKKIKKYKLPLYTAKKTFLKFVIENFR
jgi:nucleoside-diphosphate-sugar epimerase